MLAPTRELAHQIQMVVMALGDYMGASCISTNVPAKVQKLQMGAPYITVGTLGHVFDMLNHRYLFPNTSRCLYWVKLMKCCVEDSRTRAVLYFKSSIAGPRLFCCLQKCLLMCLR